MKLTKAKTNKLAEGLKPFLSYEPGPYDAYAREQPATPEAHAQSVRHLTHRGRQIEIHTQYKILVDGAPLDIHLMVGDDGLVHCHALPNYGFRSTVDLIRQLLESFSRRPPDDELGSKTKPRASRAGRSRVKAKS